VYHLILNDSYNSTELGVSNSRDDLIQQATHILEANHLPSQELNIWQESEERTVVDYGSWTHFFYIDKDEKGANDV